MVKKNLVTKCLGDDLFLPLGELIVSFAMGPPYLEGQLGKLCEVSPHLWHACSNVQPFREHPAALLKKLHRLAFDEDALALS